MLPPLSGLVPSPAVLLDERSRPDFRDVFGHMVQASSDIAVAVTRVRLSTLDLDRADLAKVQSLRVLVAELNALTLDSEARLIRADARRAPRVKLFRDLLEEGRLEVRSAPLGGWSPDFTVFSNEKGPQSVVTGFHWVERPYPHRGPALSPMPIRLAAQGHAEPWKQAHGKCSAVWSILSTGERGSRPADQSPS